MATTGMTHIEVTASTRIAATPERVWALVSEMSRYATSSTGAPLRGHPVRERVARDHRDRAVGRWQGGYLHVASATRARAVGASILRPLKSQTRRAKERTVRKLAEFATAKRRASTQS